MTKFSEIYQLNKRINTELIGKPRNYYFSKNFDYLTFAISYFRNTCNKNLDNIIQFSEVEYEFVGNGTNNRFTLSPAPSVDSQFYIAIDDGNNYSFSYDTNTNILAITPTPTNNANIYISAYVEGEFLDTLNITEKIILAEGMTVPYLEEKRNRENLLVQMVSNKDAYVSSQANHINAVQDSLDNQYFKKVEAMINKYSFAESLDGLKGLGGGLT